MKTWKILAVKGVPRSWGINSIEVLGGVRYCSVRVLQVLEIFGVLEVGAIRGIEGWRYSGYWGYLKYWRY
jgi:hypothetical protein